MAKVHRHSFPVALPTSTKTKALDTIPPAPNAEFIDFGGTWVRAADVLAVETPRDGVPGALVHLKGGQSFVVSTPVVQVVTALCYLTKEVC